MLNLDSRKQDFHSFTVQFYGTGLITMIEYQTEYLVFRVTNSTQRRVPQIKIQLLKKVSNWTLNHTTQ